MAYHAPASLREAAQLLEADPTARVLAGGTDLIVQMRAGRTAPGAVIDLKRIAGISGVRDLPGGGFAIGAATACTALQDHPALVASWPGVVEAANLIGSVQVRNRATIAGNLCNASPAADSVPALIAAGATALVVGPGGVREVPVEAIPAGPGRTTLAPGEVVAEIRLPARPVGGGDAYLRLIPRTEMDIAIVGAGAALVLGADGTCTAARVALGAVAATSLRLDAAAAALVGTRLDEAALAAMAAAACAAARPIDDKRGSAVYRTAMAGVLARRAVLIAAARAGGKA
ncbi:MAG: xanthine dehydrogenase family protein subunit M [Pseudomonadota bacterium]